MGSESENKALQDMVLVGGGHGHVAVLRRFGMAPPAGVRLTLVCRDLHTPYSGMIPGFIAGHYDFDATHIDLAPLARFAGARLLHAEAIGLDPLRRRVLCRDRPPVAYDWLSLDIGSVPAVAGVPGAALHAVAVKPVAGLVRRWREFCARLDTLGHPARIAIVGGGAGGVELALAMRHRLADGGASAAIMLVTDAPAAPSGYGAKVQRRVARILHRNAIAVCAGRRVAALDAEALHFEDGRRERFDIVFWATQAAPAAWLAESGLALDAAGFIAVSERLRSLSHPEVFACGDVASIVGRPHPKAGVYAVRQGPVLAENLRRTVEGKPLRRYRPQRRFLSLISAGDRSAIAVRGPLVGEGAWAWRWKDRIDRKFMRAYNELPAMTEREASRSSMAMRCGGCGSKLGGDLLARVLARLEIVARSDVKAGLTAADDAALVVAPPDLLSVRTVDFFPAFIDDPYVFGKIVAHHALSDIYAMGAEPQTALAIAGVPLLPERLAEEDLFQMLAGAVAVLNEAGAALVGGHSTEAAQLQMGLAVDGLADPCRLLHKHGLRSNDALILTKAIGAGALFAAAMRGRAKGRWIAAAVESMLRSNAAAARIVAAHGARACTDVTGFGLIGHLLEMTQASRVGAEIALGPIRWLAGARESVAGGIVSSLHPQNAKHRQAIEESSGLEGDPRYQLLFDPQTAGGLLAGVANERAPACLAALHAAGYAEAALIGRVTARTAGAPIRVRE